MGIAGNLKTMELAELLQWLSQSQKTGTLMVKSTAVEKRIFFRDGVIISSASTDPHEHLGQFLVSHGFITEVELAQAVQMQASNKMLLGKILTTIGAISEQNLHRMLRMKAEESIYDVFAWAEGDFKFLDNELPINNMVPIAIDVAAIVLEGMQRLDEWRRIREVIPGPESIPVSLGPFDERLLNEGGRQILALVDDERSVIDICRLSHASEFHVCRALLRQHQAGRLKVVRISPRPAGDSPRVAPIASADGISAEILLVAARQLLERGDFESTLRHLRAARALEPDARKIGAEAQEIEERIREVVERDGIVATARPELARTMEELTRLQISPQEGFLLTRMTGGENVQALLRLVPIPQLEAQLVFWKLLKAGHIRLK